jgi:hypothetical protein
LAAHLADQPIDQRAAQELLHILRALRIVQQFVGNLVVG